MNQGALVETLIQLSNFRQYTMAESLLAACSREQLEALLGVAERAFSRRLTYSLEKQLSRSKAVEGKHVLSELMKILNAWCAEGHRSAIRCVLMELRHAEVTALGRMPELDREVHSMLHEYGLPYELPSCQYI